MPQIFISYRRGDAGYVAEMLRKRLREDFGADSVFIDIDNIPIGVNFRDYLSKAIAKCDVMLALISDNWLGTAADSTKRRIDDPEDLVRIEVEAALVRGIPVVPVLVGNGALPNAGLLPDGLQPLTGRQATELRPGPNLNAQLEWLVRGMHQHFKGIKENTPLIRPADPKPATTKTVPCEEKTPVSVAKASTRPPRADAPKAKDLDCRPSYWTAVGWHLLFGLGLIYLESRSKRRWVYPAFASYLALDILLAFLGVTSPSGEYGVFGVATGIVAFSIFALSFIEVISVSKGGATSRTYRL